MALKCPRPWGRSPYFTRRSPHGFPFFTDRKLQVFSTRTGCSRVSERAYSVHDNGIQDMWVATHNILKYVGYEKSDRSRSLFVAVGVCGNVAGSPFYLIFCAVTCRLSIRSSLFQTGSNEYQSTASQVSTFIQCQLYFKCI